MLGMGGPFVSTVLLRFVSVATLSGVCFFSSRLLRHLRPSSAHRIDPTPNPNPKIKGKLFCASETDNCKILCLHLRVLLLHHSIDLDIVNPIDYNPNYLKNEPLIVIVASTLEGGKPPPNAETLARWLSKQAEDSRMSMRLERCRFAVYGVSRAYGNAFGRNLVRWMSSMGASRILPLANGNSDNWRFNTIFFTWSFNLILKLNCHTPMPMFQEINSLDDEFGDDKFGADDRKFVSAENRDANVLKEILPPIIPTNLENQPGIMTRRASVIFVLLGHKMQSRPCADRLLDESNVYSVASLYRMEIGHEMDDSSGTQSLGLPLFKFTSDKYPFGMGCGAIGSKPFLVGGYIHAPKFSTEVGRSPIYDPSNKLYVLDTSSINSSATHDEIAKIIEIKDSPCLRVDTLTPKETKIYWNFEICSDRATYKDYVAAQNSN